MRAVVIEVKGDVLYLEVPGQIRFTCPFLIPKGLRKMSKDDVVDITFRLLDRRLVATVNRVD